MTPAPGVIKGLPEGVEIVDFLPCEAGDYELVRANGVTEILKGQRPGAASGVKVRAGEGYIFVQVGREEIFDIKEMKVVSGRPIFQAVKEMEPFTMKIEEQVLISNRIQLDEVNALVDQIRHLPGYVTSEQVKNDPPTT